jgi:hypothetical protein
VPDVVPSVGAVPAVVPVGSVPAPVAVPVPVPIPVLLVPVLEPVEGSVPSSGGVDPSVGSEVEELLLELPSSGIVAAGGPLSGWIVDLTVLEE